MSVTPGFGTLGIPDILINGVTLTALTAEPTLTKTGITRDVIAAGKVTNAAIDITQAINDVLIEYTAEGASTVTIIVTDPFRTILNSGIINQGDTMTLDGLSYTYVQLNKASDQLQMVFESTGVNNLRKQKGIIATTASTTIAGFAQMLVSQVPGLKFIGAITKTFYAIQLGRGSTSTPNETSWQCLQRIANSAAWRCWEYNTIIYFGPDNFWLQQPPAATFQEFTPTIAEMDVSWDIGQPYGNLTATAFCGLIQYRPGQVINVVTMGPATGTWLVEDMQRDLYSPLATITLMAPLTPTEIKTAEAGANATSSGGGITGGTSGGNTTGGLTGEGTATPATAKNGNPGINVTVSPSTVGTGKAFTVTANVTGGTTGKTPGGTITFLRNTNVMANGGTVPLKKGIAAITIKQGLKNPGAYQIVAKFAPGVHHSFNPVTSAPIVLTVTTGQ